MVRGIDKGTTYTKDDQDNIIRSTIQEAKSEILLDNKLTVEMFGKKYIVGEKGRYGTDLMKAYQENTRVLIYTILAIGSDNNTVISDIVLGLPIGLYASQKNDMKALFQGREVVLKVNGVDRYVKIEKCEIFPESAGAYYSQSDQDVLIIDIGGLSVDNAQFTEGKLGKFSTYSMGTMKLYNKIANRLNGEYDLSLTEWDIPDVLQKGLQIYGNKVELNIQDIVENHVIEIIERLKLQYDLKIENCMLTGGGSVLLYDYIKKHLPKVKLIDYNFANAKGFKRVGEVLFNGKKS